jgi:hypothetical protein
MGLLSSIGSIAGSYFGGPVGGAIGGTLGGALEGGGSSGSNVTGAYDTASAAQLQAARNAQFRPVGITTTFGKSNFQIDPNTGQLVSAGYTLSPELQDLQTRLLSGYGGLLSQAQGVNTDYLNQGAGQLASLGQGYLGESPEAIRNRYISQQNALLAPLQEQELAGIRNKLYQTGRTGLATGGTTTGLQATNPEMAAYYNSLARTNAQLAANADIAAQNQATFGSGLLSKAAGLTSTGYGLQTAAYDPLKTQLGLGTSIESMGAQPLTLGSELGGRASTAGAAAGTLASTAAQTGLAGQIAQQGLNATANTSTMNQLTGLFGGQGGVNTPGYAGPLGQVGSWFNNLIGGGSSSPFSGVTGYNANAFSPTYGTQLVEF